jgi:hypothetical protein
MMQIPFSIGETIKHQSAHAMPIYDNSPIYVVTNVGPRIRRRRPFTTGGKNSLNVTDLH